MSIVKKLLGGWGKGARKGGASDANGRPPLHAVMVHLELTGGKYGSEDEVEEIRLLGDDCEEALRQGGLGEFEGEEFGDAECVLYFSGTDAEQIWSALSPIIRTSRLSRGGHVVQRFGGDGAREARIAISS